MINNLGISRRQLRAIGHKLKPVLTVSQNGLTEGVLLELDRALTDHELIKVKISSKSANSNEELLKGICEHSSAKIVQHIGNVLILIRRNKKPNPKLSNLIRVI